MGDLYEKIRKEPGEKGRPSLPLLIIGAVLLLSLMGLIIVRPIYEHRKFMGFLGSLSESTVSAAAEDSLRCEREGQPPLRLTLENTYAVYNKLLATGRGTRSRDIPQESGVLLDYGNGATLELWPRTFTGKGRTEGVFVRYTDPAGGVYAYYTNRTSYSNLLSVLTARDNPPWDGE